MKKVMLITYHHCDSKRKAGFHWLADAFYKMGWEVTFFTAAISYLSYLNRNFRIKYLDKRKKNEFVQIKENFLTYIWFTNWHPVNFRFSVLNKFASGFFKNYSRLLKDKAVEDKVKETDLFIFESFPGFFLFPKFKKLNPTARFVYRVSDDIRLFEPHQTVLDLEKKISTEFDLVSVPSNYILKKFEGLDNLRLQYHGINKNLFDEKHENPYSHNEDNPNLIFTGISYFDFEFLEISSQLFPNWQFHIFGPMQNTTKADNVKFYGELPYEKVIPYIKYADISLQALSYSKSAVSFTDSLKILQYTYCKLPIVAPEFLKSERKNMFYYKPGDRESIRDALLNTQKFDKDTFDNSGIHSWEELAKELADGN